jgi:hypothetical protein
LSFIRTFVDNYLPFTVSLRDFTRPLVQRRPIQPRKRRVIEKTFNDVTNESRLTIAMGAGQIKLATTIYGAIAVIVCFAFE